MNSDFKKAHVFVVDRYSFPVHSCRLFCAVKNPRKEYGFSGKYGLYATLKCTRIGDLVFFYQRRIDEPQEERGFRGIYEITSDPFFADDEVIWGSSKVLGKCPRCGSTHPEKSDEDGSVSKCGDCGTSLRTGEHILPYRILIKTFRYFEKSVDDNTAYVDQTDPGTLWTMLFRKVYGPGRERSVTPILPEEASKLIRLLNRNNRNTSLMPATEPYKPSNTKPVQIDLKCDPKDYSKVKYEHILQAWFMENIDKDVPVLKDLVGPREQLEWFGNEVIYGIGGDKVDVLTLHKADGIRFKATVFELKDGEVGISDVAQIERYSYWISQLVTANSYPRVRSMTLQPVLVGHYFSHDTLSAIRRVVQKQVRIPYPWGDCDVSILPPSGLIYRLESGKIKFDYAQPMRN